MMLQGHFVDKMLHSSFKDFNDPGYSFWYFFRGMTAPIFFTVTGIVFVYLLVSKGGNEWPNPRVKAGLRRGGFLIFMGYLLKQSITTVAILQVFPHQIVVDVLQCIGLAIWALIGLYVLQERYLKIPLPVGLLIVGFGLFFTEPLYASIDWSFLPVFFANYLTKAYGSVFTPLPWIGYTLIGGALGWHIAKKTALYRTYAWPLVLIVLGFLTQQYIGKVLLFFFDLNHFQLLADVAYNNYLLIPLGRVFVAIGIFILLEKILGKFPRFVLKLGTETLTIYGAHYVVLYGTWIGLDIFGYFSGLTPLQSGIGAVLFVGAFVGLIWYIEPIRVWLAPKEAYVKHLLLWIRLEAIRLLILVFYRFSQTRYQPELGALGVRLQLIGRGMRWLWRPVQAIPGVAALGGVIRQLFP